MFSEAEQIVGIEQKPCTFDVGRDLLQQSEPLAARGGLDVCESGNVTAGA